jgi:hypothetical protein
MRKRGFAIGRMYYAHPTSGERYYLWMLLNYVKGATSYKHLQTMDGIEHNIFKDACIVMGLFANDNEWHQCRNPNLVKCGGEAQHLEKWGFRVLRDSRMFRARQQGAKHLALGCSWCHWKFLET